MARVTVLPNGVTASFPRSGPMDIEPPKRGKVRGWTRQATGRLRRWFYSVDGDELDGVGFALTLTIRVLPPTAADWVKTRERFMERLRAAGRIRGQWLTEWQRRGVPHLHGCVFFPVDSGVTREDVVNHWLAAAAEWGAGLSSQAVTPLWGLSGWLQYQAKHSVRGVQHYQRANVPEAWQEGTGRLWGRVGDWPVREELVEVSTATFHRFRRLMRDWLVSGARVEVSDAAGPWPATVDVEKAMKRERAALRRLLFLEGMLTCSDRNLSSVRAIGEFCPEPVARQLLAAAELRSVPAAVVEVATGEVLTGWAGLEAACRGVVEPA